MNEWRMCLGGSLEELIQVYFTLSKQVTDKSQWHFECITFSHSDIYLIYCNSKYPEILLTSRYISLSENDSTYQSWKINLSFLQPNIPW